MSDRCGRASWAPPGHAAGSAERRSRQSGEAPAAYSCLLRAYARLVKSASRRYTPVGDGALWRLNWREHVPRGSLVLTVENLGPIREGSVELRPLTLLVGPNSSGKSYFALLAYALARALVRPLVDVWPYLAIQSHVRSPEFHEVARSWFHRFSNTQLTLTWSELPESLRNDTATEFENLRQTAAEYITPTLHEYFGVVDLRDIIRKGDARGPLSVRVTTAIRSKPILSVRLASTYRKKPAVSLEGFEPQEHPVSLQTLEQSGHLVGAKLLPDARALSHLFWLQTLTDYGVPHAESFYLPSARSGILQGWAVFASMAVDFSRRRIGGHPVTIPPVAGVGGDFLQALWDRIISVPPRDPPESMRPALELLETRVMRGAVAATSDRVPGSSIVFQDQQLTLPLHRASAMVAELAPLDLWIRQLLSPGDLLVVDEPEAHLHPENQRLVGLLLARLARAGVQVICPTHSSLILNQVSNSLLAKRVAKHVREELGFTSDDVLDPEDVGVYLFQLGRAGSKVDPVSLDEEYGISEARIRPGSRGYRGGDRQVSPGTAGIDERSAPRSPPGVR